jgi:diguanylate cyclase (GGDEF)-like protein
LNRLAFERELDRFLDRSRRYADRGALRLDPDRFKPINDAFGHATGDETLRAVADPPEGRLRQSDISARIAGDEFAVLLQETDYTDAVGVAADLLAAISAVNVKGEDSRAWTTASIGLTHIEGHTLVGAEQLFAQADDAMYRAKRSGGNQIDTHQASHEQSHYAANATASSR